MHRTISEIITAVSVSAGVSEEKILSDDTSPQVMMARHAIIHIAITKYKHSQNAVALAIKRNRSTVSGALLKIEARIKWDVPFVQIYDKSLGLLGHTGSAPKIDPDPVAADRATATVYGLSIAQLDECRKLQKKGWSVFGLSKRYLVPVRDIEAVCGIQRDRW